MRRKIISLFTLLAFIVFSLSCYTWKTKEIRTAADLRGEKGKVLWVIKKSGEYIEFSKDNPGRVIGDKIVGKAIILSKKVVIDRANIEENKRDQNGKILKITTKDGKMYTVINGTEKEEKDKITCFARYESNEQVFIPLSEVKWIHVLIYLGILLVIGLVLTIALGGLFPPR
jgi:hypothetical protein